MKIVRATSATPGESVKARAMTMPAEMLDKALPRICLLSFISAISTVAFFVTDGFLQPEAAVAQESPFLRGIALSMVLLSVGYMALQRTGALSKQMVLYLSVPFQVMVAFAISLADNMLLTSPGHPVVGVATVCLWILLCGILIPNHPTLNLTANLLSALSWPIAYYFDMSVMGLPFIGWNRLAMWMMPIVMTTFWSTFINRHLYAMRLKSERADELGSYTLEKQLAAGGMGEVWLAHHRMLKRDAAVKLIRPDLLSGQSIRGENVIRRRFEREAQATAALRNPHTVALFDFGMTQEGMFYYVMELLEGIDLQALVQKFGPMHPGRVKNILIQVCESLEEAHRLSMVHRDIKPRNIFLSKLGWQHDFAKVLDFGLVKTLMKENETMMTMDGSATGTPAYMAPEVAMGAKVVDGRADIYSLGCVAYFMLTGQLVFNEGSATAMALAHVQKQPQRLTLRTEMPIPESLERIVLQCLDKDPEKRPRSAQDLARKLEAVKDVPVFCRDRASDWWSTNLPNFTYRADESEMETAAELEAVRSW
jgi:serine/threonine-protein kinase